MNVIKPHACAWGKVVGRVITVVVSTKITISRDAAIYMYVTRKHNEFGKKLALVCIKSRDTVHEHHK